MAGPRMTAERAYELARAGVTPEQIGDVDIREQVYSVLNDPELSPSERLDAATALSQSEGAGGPAKDELESTYRAPGLGQAAVGAVGVLGTMDKDDFAMGGPAGGPADFNVSFADPDRGFALVSGLGEGWGVPGGDPTTRKIQIGDYLPGGLAVTDITSGGIQVIPESEDEFAPPGDEYVIGVGGKTQVYKPQPQGQASRSSAELMQAINQKMKAGEPYDELLSQLQSFEPADQEPGFYDESPTSTMSEAEAKDISASFDTGDINYEEYIESLGLPPAGPGQRLTQYRDPGGNITSSLYTPDASGGPAEAHAAVLPWDEPSGAIPDWLSRQDEAVTGGVIRRHLESPTGLMAKIKQYDAPLFEQMFGAADESESAGLAALRGNPAYRRQFEDTIQMFKEAPDLPPLSDTPISEIAGAEDLTDSERASRLAAHEGLVWMHQKRDEIRGELGSESAVPTPEQREIDDKKLEEAMWFETEGGRVLTGEEGEGGPEEATEAEDEAELQRVMEAMEDEEEPWYQGSKEWVEEQALQVGEGVRRTGEWVEGQAKEFAEDPGKYYTKKLWPTGRIAESIKRYQAGESLMEATDAEAMLIAADIIDPTMISQIAAASLYELEGDHTSAAITLGAGLAGVGVGVLAANLAKIRRANKIALEARGVTGGAVDEMTSRAIRDAHRQAAPSTYGPLKKFGREPGGRGEIGEWERTRHLAKPQGRVVLPDGVEVQYWRHPDYPDQIIRERIWKPGESMMMHQTVDIMPQGRWVDEAFGPGVRPLDLGDPDWPGMAQTNPDNIRRGLHKGRGDVPTPGRKPDLDPEDEFFRESWRDHFATEEEWLEHLGAEGLPRTRRSPEAGRDLSKVEARRAKVEALDQYKDIQPHGPIGGTRIRASTVAKFRDDLVVFSRGKDGTPSTYIHPEYPDKVLVPGASGGKAWRVSPRPDRYTGMQKPKTQIRPDYDPSKHTSPYYKDPYEFEHMGQSKATSPRVAERYQRTRQFDEDEIRRILEGYKDMDISRVLDQGFVDAPVRGRRISPGRQIDPPAESTRTVARVVEDPKRYWNTELDKANQRLREHRALGGKADPDVEIQILQDIDEINEALWELGPRYPMSPPLPRGQ